MKTVTMLHFLLQQTAKSKNLKSRNADTHKTQFTTKVTSGSHGGSLLRYDTIQCDTQVTTFLHILSCYTSSFAPLQNSQCLSLVCSQPHSPSSFPYHFHLFSQSPTLRMEASGSYKMVVHVTSTNINYIWQAGGTGVTW